METGAITFLESILLGRNHLLNSRRNSESVKHHPTVFSTQKIDQVRYHRPCESSASVKHHPSVFSMPEARKKHARSTQEARKKHAKNGSGSLPPTPIARGERRKYISTLKGRFIGDSSTIHQWFIDALLSHWHHVPAPRRLGPSRSMTAAWVRAGDTNRRVKTASIF